MLLKPAFQSANVPWLSDLAGFEGKQMKIYENTLGCLLCFNDGLIMLMSRSPDVIFRICNVSCVVSVCKLLIL